MVKILIPAKKLKDGLDKDVRHIASLLEASEILYESKKFSESLPLSILALEEVTKLKTIRDHYIKKMGITNKEWFDLKKGGSHKKKLTQPSEERKKRLHEMGEERFEVARQLKQMIGDPLGNLSYEQMKNASKGYLNMGKLDKIKQDCFYLDWQDSKWVSARIKLSPKQLEALSWVSLEITKWFLNQIMLYSKHPEIELDENSESYKKYASDPLLKKDQEFKKLFGKSKFLTKITIATKTLENY